MNPRKIIAGLEAGLRAVDDLASGTDKDTLSGLANDFAAIGQDVLNSASGLASADMTRISDLVMALQAKADELAG